jgi:hypothetical protein
MSREVTRKDVMKAVRRAQKASMKASDAAFEANAMVSTYWKSQLRPWLISQDYREASGLAYSLSISLLMVLEADFDSPKV